MIASSSPIVGADLRGVDDSDLSFLYALAAKDPARWDRICWSGLPSPHGFAGALWEKVFAQYIVMADERPVGMVGAYNASLRDQTAWVEILMMDGDASEAVRAEVLTKVVNRLFVHEHLRKVYGVFHDFEPPIFRNLPATAHEEGRYPLHTFHESLYWDRVVHALYRHEWPSALPPA